MLKVTWSNSFSSSAVMPASTGGSVISTFRTGAGIEAETELTTEVDDLTDPDMLSAISLSEDPQEREDAQLSEASGPKILAQRRALEAMRLLGNQRYNEVDTVTNSNL